MTGSPQQQSFFNHAAFDAQQSVAMPQATVHWQPDWLAMADADNLMAALYQHTPWQQLPISMFGRTVMQPRLLAWYGDHAYTYSGLTLSPRPWTPELLDLKARVEAAAHARFNTVLLNLYRDGSDYMGWHKDDEAELGERPTIASVSLGASRRFLFRHTKSKEKREFLLSHGALLVMAGQTQTYWQHALPKTQKPVGARINLTFRWITSSSGKE